MSVVLTQAQQDQVDQFAKSEPQLPQYYSADLQTYVTISRDFEAFLILLPTATKTAAITWITQVLTLAKANKLRDQLRALVNAQEVKNAKLLQDAYGTRLSDFDAFRGKFLSDSTFEAVPEVTLFMDDLQLAIDEQIFGQQRAFFDQTLGLIFQRGQGVQQITQATIQELQSWIPVISAYLGGT